MNVPYNNGKIKIGQYYQHPLPTYEYDKDMTLLQTSLIGDIKTIKRDRLYSMLYIGAVVFGLFGAILLTKN